MNNYNFNIIDLNLSQLRSLFYKSQREVADVLKISKQLYSLKELGKVYFKEREIEGLAKCFNLPYKIIDRIILNKQTNKIIDIIEGV